MRWVFPEPRVLNLTGHQIVGRDPDCGLHLPGLEISRRHAEFLVDGPIVVLRDLGSRNGIYLNGKRRDAGPIVAGDVLRCGEWVGVVTGEHDDLGFRELGPGWYGGATLARAVADMHRVPSDFPIVVQGETGTGKECAARAMHAGSRRVGELVAVNCASLPDHLVESQLFGHKKGAFTGADRASSGFFRAADLGTLFLDEIQELPIAIQPKLLRAIERREVLPVGETFPVPVDVRILAATQEPLTTLVDEGRFRPDLQARLDGLTIVLPPLRSRREDIVPLFLEFLTRQALQPMPTVDTRLAEALCLYDWPLNVRELLLLTRRLAAIHGSEPMLCRDHLPARMLGMATEQVERTAESAKVKRSWRPVANQSEFDALSLALKEHRGNMSRAAAAIGISRARAYRLISAHAELDVRDD